MGVGAEVARRLHEKGANLVLTDVDTEALRDIGTELGQDRVLTAVADVRELPAMKDAVSGGVDRFGGIDIVMANAGIATYGSVLKVDPEAFRLLIDVNIVGVFNTVRAALPAVVDRRGYVLVVSSAAAFAASPGLAPYDTAKAGVEHFANALRLEVAHLGVAVGSAHMLVDRHPPGAGRQVGPAGLSQVARSDARSARQDDLGRGLRRGIREGHRGPQTLRLLSRVCLAVALVQAAAVHACRRVQHSEGRPQLLPQMDAEVEALGRSISARTEEKESDRTHRRSANSSDVVGGLRRQGSRRGGQALAAAHVGRRHTRSGRAIAKEAYVYGFPMVDNYRVMYSYFVNKQDPEYKGGWNEIHSAARVYTPDDKTIQTPNSDTPVPLVGADLRSEPLVLTVPPIEQDRYYSLQFVDGYTYNFHYVGSRTHRERRRQIPSGRPELER